MNNEFPNIGLYNHNAESYKKIRKAFDDGQKEVAIVHATGTGKSYNALQLAYDNKDKKIVYIVPSMAIIEHIKQIIEENPSLGLERDFSNLEFRTYQSFINLSAEEISKIPCDLLILDEFHHIGALIWGQRIKTFLETHPNVMVFGMTAYTVRDRGTEYERDMTNPETAELFSNKVVSRYDLCDAMIEGVLPKPIYRAAYTQLIGIESEIEEKVKKMEATSDEYQRYMQILANIKRRIHEAPGIPELLKKNLKPNGKYICFCPPLSESGVNDIETIKGKLLEDLKTFMPEEDIVFYTTTSQMGIEGKRNRDAFYHDLTLDGDSANDKLRIMFAINQYNEGVHAPNVDGVIMGRGTSSDIVYFEQLGRALSVRGKTKEDVEKYETMSVAELQLLCNQRDIKYNENITKEELIEKLIAPVIIDLSCNIEFIKTLENDLKDRIKEATTKGEGSSRQILLTYASFDISIENIELFEILEDMYDKLVMTWDDWYKLAAAYYEENGNLNIPRYFCTFNGYTSDSKGKELGKWLHTQKIYKLYGRITKERIEKLENIGIVWNLQDEIWDQKYRLAAAYYNHYGNLDVPKDFKTKDGITPDESGESLGLWILVQRKLKKNITDPRASKRIELLDKIGMLWDVNYSRWLEMYKLAEKYYEYHGNLLVPGLFKTNDGIHHDDNGKYPLGSWISRQRVAKKGVKNSTSKINDEQIAMLDQIGMVWEVLEKNLTDMFAILIKYYNHYGNINVPSKFVTNDGINFDNNGKKLGSWLADIRRGKTKITQEQIDLLNKMGIVWSPLEEQWDKMYSLAEKYYNHFHNLIISSHFKTKDGITYDEDGVALGTWLFSQKYAIKNMATSRISPERVARLKKIGISENASLTRWSEFYELAKSFYIHNGHLQIPVTFRTNDGFTPDKDGIKLGFWIANVRQTYAGKGSSTINEEQIRKLDKIGMIWSIRGNLEKVKELSNRYSIDFSKNRKALEHISILEFEVKLAFLKDMNISYIDDKGKLHAIFSMSSVDMKSQYGVSLDDLIDTYGKKETK